MAAHPIISEVLRLWRFAGDQVLLTGIDAVSVDAPLFAMQQVRQQVSIVNIGRRDHGVVRQSALTIDSDKQFHAETLCMNAPGLPIFQFTMVRRYRLQPHIQTLFTGDACGACWNSLVGSS